MKYKIILPQTTLSIPPLINILKCCDICTDIHPWNIRDIFKVTSKRYKAYDCKQCTAYCATDYCQWPSSEFIKLTWNAFSFSCNIFHHFTPINTIEFLLKIYKYIPICVLYSYAFCLNICILSIFPLFILNTLW